MINLNPRSWSQLKSINTDIRKRYVQYRELRQTMCQNVQLRKLLEHYLKLFSSYSSNQKNVHYICSITPKRVTNGEARLRGSTSGQHRSEETSQRCRAAADTASEQTTRKLKPRPSAPVAMPSTATQSDWS